jgi:putative PIN family toxin of toxin-antitoxin system
LRAVLDVNVIISGVLAPAGAPARVLSAWCDGAFELIVSPKLLAELRRTLSYPKLRKYIEPRDASALLEWLARLASHADDSRHTPIRSADEADDYLIALAASNEALLVSGDRHLLELAHELPILPPARFLELIDSA